MLVRPSGRPRAVMFWTSLLLILAGAIAWRVTWVYGAVREELGKQLVLSLASTGASLQSWRATHLGHAELAASVLGEDAVTQQRRFHIVGERLAQREGFSDGWLVTAAGDLAASLRGTPLPAKYRVAPGDGALSATYVLRCPGGEATAGTCVDFRAAIADAADSARVAGQVVFRLPARDSTFTMLRPPRDELRERAAVLAPLDGQPDSVVVLVSRGNFGDTRTGTVVAMRALPPPVLAAFRAARAASVVPVSGRGRGMSGEDVYYAAGAVDGTGWVLARELEAKPIIRQMNIQLAIEETLIASLVIALAALIRNRVRAGRRRRLEEITTLRADFVASTSHELRTPLAQIRMFAELLRKGSLRNAEEADRALRIIEKEASRLTILVDNILNYARLRRRGETRALERDEAGDGTGVAAPPADVAVDVEQALEAFSPLALERGVRVVSAVEGRPYAAADSQALRQVLINFLENAVKYGPRGQTVSVGACQENGKVRLWVDDEGPGVPPAERERIWRAFHRGSTAESSAQGGSGIGLAVVRDLVLQAGGRVEIERSPAGGARFVAELPAAVIPSEAAERPTRDLTSR